MSVLGSLLVLLGSLALLALGPDAAAQGLPTGTKLYIKASDQALYLHAHGGSSEGDHETLHACPKQSAHPNCQWILEPSPSRSGAYYVRVSHLPLYLHSHGGSAQGNHQTLHSCPKGNDHPNCQWILEPSPSRPGAHYLRASDQSLYLHSHGGSVAGAHQTLHACPKGNDHPNCQWILETANAAPVAPQAAAPPPPQAGPSGPAFSVGESSSRPALIDSKFSKATKRGKAGCPPGTFLDIGRGDCWSCPSGYRRTIFAVTKPNACERPAYAKHARATHHGRGSGFLGMQCGAGQFRDLNGNCYSCPSGYRRTIHAVTHEKACEQPVKVALAPATKAKDFCAAGSFLDIGRGECWSCPSGWHRTVNAIDGDKACSSDVAGIFALDAAATCKSIIQGIRGAEEGMKRVLDDLAPVIEPVLAPLEEAVAKLDAQIGVPAELDQIVDRAGAALRPHRDRLADVGRLSSALQGKAKELRELFLDPGLVCGGDVREIDRRLTSLGLRPQTQRAGSSWLGDLLVKSAHAETKGFYMAWYLTYTIRNPFKIGKLPLPNLTFGEVIVTNYAGKGGVFFVIGPMVTTKKGKFLGDVISPSLGFFAFARSQLSDFTGAIGIGSLSTRLHFGTPKRVRRLYSALGLTTGIVPNSINVTGNPLFFLQPAGDQGYSLPGFGASVPIFPSTPPARDPRTLSDIDISGSYVAAIRLHQWE